MYGIEVAAPEQWVQMLLFGRSVLTPSKRPPRLEDDDSSGTTVLPTIHTND